MLPLWKGKSFAIIGMHNYAAYQFAFLAHNTSAQTIIQPGMVAQTYSPSHSGGRDQWDHSSRPAQQKVSKISSQQQS
jgi:hypothetical protein